MITRFGTHLLQYVSSHGDKEAGGGGGGGVEGARGGGKG